MPDRGLTHIALAVSDLDRSIDFYARYAAMQVIHRRESVAWISDKTRPFAIVLIEKNDGDIGGKLAPLSHLGVALDSRAAVDEAIARAKEEGCFREGPYDSGPPVGYWVFLDDPDGHTLELTYGQDVDGAVEHG